MTESYVIVKFGLFFLAFIYYSTFNEYSIASCSTLSANAIVDLFYSKLLSVADEFTLYKTDSRESRGSFESRMFDYLTCHPVLFFRIYSAA